MNYNKDNGLLNMIRRTDPMIKKINPFSCPHTGYLTSSIRPQTSYLRHQPSAPHTSALSHLQRIKDVPAIRLTND